MEIGKILIIVVISYLLGAIPAGMLISKVMGKIDITKYGSGNVGTANVTRTLGPKAGVAVTVIDLGKSIIALLLANIIIGNDLILWAGFPDSFQGQVAQVSAALMAMIGHNWSVFMKFRGGKGVTAYEGGWLVICPPIALFGGALFIPTVLFTKYVSLGSIIGTLGIFLLVTVLTLALGNPPIYLAYSFVGLLSIVYQHRDNIGRLRAGTERKMSLNLIKSSPNPS